MKYILSIIFLSMTMMLSAKSYLRDTYIVVSDEQSSDVPKGSCRIFGTIHNGAGILQNALVSNLDRSRTGVSNQKGEYSFLLSSLDTSVFFFKEGFNEQMIWSYQFKSGHAVRIDFYAGNNIEVLEVDKPVIYMYSERDIDVSIYPDFKGDLSFTYPVMTDQWDVSITDNKIIDRNTSLSFPYLFWEGEMTNLDFHKDNQAIEGELLHKSQVVGYLEKSLSSIGLNQTEKTDFITFWGPKMTMNEYSFIQLLEDDQVDAKIGELKISPEPSNMKRVFMLFKTFEILPDIECTPQQFSKIERDGFTLLEWGGSEINHTKIAL